MGSEAPQTSKRGESADKIEAALPSRDIRVDGDDTKVANDVKKLATKINAGDRPECFKNTFQEVGFVVMATLDSATSSFLAGTSVVVTAAIGRDLHMSQGEISWIQASNSLAAGAFQLALGQLADLLGRRVLFLIGLATFSAGSIITAFAQNPFWMDILCGVLGLGSAMVVPPAIGILGAAYAAPSKRKNLAFSAFSAGQPIGFVFGSIFCGIAARLFDWRAAFVLLAILWAVFTVVGYYFVPAGVEAYAEGLTLRERFHGSLDKFDIVGTVLTIFGTGMFTAALTLAPTDGWRAPHVIALLVVGVVLLGIFIMWERVFANPLMPPHIWKDRNFTVIILVVILGSMAFLSANFWLAFYMQELQGLDSLTVALHLLPQAIAGILWNIIAGHILHVVNNTLIAAIGGICYLAANLLLAFMRPDSSYWAFIFPALILNVVGADFQFNIANMYVMQSLPSHQQSTAGGMFNTLVRLGSTIALGISTAVYTSVALTDASMADPMLKYQRAFLVSVGLAGASLVFLPFLKIGTQGHSAPASDTDEIPLPDLKETGAKSDK